VITDRYEMVAHLFERLTHMFESRVDSAANYGCDIDYKDRIRAIIKLKEEYDHVFAYLIDIAPVRPKLEGKGS
jgi:hypothetical protein